MDVAKDMESRLDPGDGIQQIRAPKMLNPRVMLAAFIEVTDNAIAISERRALCT